MTRRVGLNSKALIIHQSDITETAGEHDQALALVEAATNAGIRHLAGGLVQMPPGGFSSIHYHENSEVVVVIISGNAATVVWEDRQLRTLPHGADEMCYVPTGVPHCVVNLSMEHPLAVLEFYTGHNFNSDIVLLPELENQIEDIVTEVRAGEGGPR